LEKFKLAKDASRSGIFLSIARVPSSSRVFAGCSDFKIYETDLAAAKPEFKELSGHTSYVTGLALSGSTLVSGSYDGKLISWDTEKREQIRSVEPHQKWIRKLALSPDGKLVASVADDMVCRVWEVASGKMVHELRGHAEKTPHHFPSMLFVC